MNTSPSRTFLLVAIVVIILLGLHFLPQLTVAGEQLRKVNILCDVVPEPSTHDDVAAAKVALPPLPQAEKSECPPGVTCIQDYSEGKAGGMDNFYRALSETGRRLVRIAYFGDSFIEGDMLTDKLRDMLQDKYGGSGVGWVDCASETAGFRRSIRANSSGFTEHAVIAPEGFVSRFQGINERYYTLSGSASSTMKGVKYMKHTASWHRSELFFRTDGDVHLSASINGGKPQVYDVSPSSGLQSVVVSGSIGRIEWQVKSAGAGSYFYGVCNETEKGIVVDNLSMRGSAGFTLGGIPQSTLEAFAAKRPYDLIILHFGLNVLSDKSNLVFFKSYKHRMEKVVESFRKAYPKASILVVSVSDRAQRYNGNIQTLSSVVTLSQYQQLIASDTHTAYFNLLQAMGGKGSIKKMAESRPSLANKDYTHLNFRGGVFVAKKFYDALIAGKDYYERHK